MDRKLHNCSVFAPNLFNKSKCQHCFASKDSHSPEALRSARETRKVSKCGYLFVAPDWDFSNPINRTKRWQRRWFILYDDGELTYSVDEHPGTIPQEIISMSDVLDVSEAEDMTGNQFSLAITAPEKVHYVKGTSREECRWWFDVLSIFPRSLKGMRHKRNATFPGSKAKIITEPVLESFNQPEECRRLPTVTPLSRPRFFSCQSELHSKTSSFNWPDGQSSDDHRVVKIISRDSILTQPLNVEKTKRVSDNCSNDDESKNGNNKFKENTSSYGDNFLSRVGGDRIRPRRVGKREQRKFPSLRPLSDSVSFMFPKSRESEVDSTTIETSNPLVLLLSEEKGKFTDDTNIRNLLSPKHQYLNNKNLAISRQLSEGGEKNLEALHFSDIGGTCKLSVEESSICTIPKLISVHEKDGLPPSSFSTLSSSSAFHDEIVLKVETDDHSVQVRGDPDGCGLDSYGHSVNVLGDAPLEEIPFVKKGWLMMEGVNKTWNKYWFLLRGTSLMFFCDTSAEENGSCEGLLDLNQVVRIEEVELARNYGFSLLLNHEQNIQLSAVTNGLRVNWIQALCKAANVKESFQGGVLTLGQKIEKEMLLLKELSCDQKTMPVQIEVPSPPRSGLSSDDEFKTASEASGRMEDYLELAEEDGTTSAASRALPPSPPLNRTPISRVKERARTRSNTRITSHSDRSEKRRHRNTSQLPKDDFVGRDELSGSDHEFCGSKHTDRSTLRTTSGIRQDGKPVASDVPEAMLIEMLELEVDSLRSRLRQYETTTSVSEREQALHEQYTHLESRYLREHATWVSQLSSYRSSTEQPAPDKMEQLEERLQQSESKILTLVTEMDDLCQSRETHVEVLCTELQQPNVEKQKLWHRSRDNHVHPSDVELLQAQLVEAKVAVEERDSKLYEFQSRMVSLKATLDKTSGDLVDVVVKLQKSTEENEDLKSKLPIQDEALPHKTEKLLELDEDNNLPRTELHIRLRKTLHEAKTLKRALKDAHKTSDELELRCIQTKQQLKRTEDDYKCQLQLMTVRVEDLTTKLSNSEKQNRQFKQKLSRQENKEQRRTRSLKGKETFTISKELEVKLSELEKKLFVIERIQPQHSLLVTDIPAKEVDGTTSNFVTIKVSDSAEPPESSVEDSLKLLVRVNSLESKVKSAVDKLCLLKIPAHTNAATQAGDVLLIAPDTTVTRSLKSGVEGLNDTVVLLSQCEEKQCVMQPQDFLLLIAECIDSAEVATNQCSCLHFSHWKVLQEKLKTARSQLSVTESWPSVHKIVVELRNLLKQKREFISEKRAILGQLGLLTTEVQVGLSSERLIHEAILVGQMSYLIRSSKATDESKERLRAVKNLVNKFAVFEKKLQCMQQKTFNERIDNQINIGVVPSPGHEINPYNEMLKYELKVKQQLDSYKTTKLALLCDLLTKKTTWCSSYGVFEGRSTSNLMPDPLSQKLIETEMKRIVARLKHLYEQEVRIDLQTCNQLLHCPRVMMEERIEVVVGCLQRNLDGALSKLLQQYRDLLQNAQPGTDSKDERDKNIVATHVAEFADVIAHHSVLVGHLDYLRNNVFSEAENVVKDLDKDNVALCLDEILTQELELLSTDTSYNLQFLLKDLDSEMAYSLIARGFNLGTGSLSRYPSAQDILNVTSTDGKPSYFHSSYEARAQRSFRQRGQRSVTMPITCIVDSTLNMPTKSSCSGCTELKQQLKSLGEKHAVEHQALKGSYTKNVKKANEDLLNQVCYLEQDNVHSTTHLREKLTLLEKTQASIRIEYEQRIAAMKETYDQEIAKKSDTKINEEAVRQRYQAEIEQLRGLCEKGLIAMENSHRRIIAELEEKHRLELEQLQVEKEQALAEETQATLAALDAMRKAHEAELQREIAKFKQEFLQKMQSSRELDTRHKEHDREELDNIKQEILSLSEKYSIKCLENASLEVHLQPLTRQLADANSQVFDLTARNKQLRAMISSSILELEEDIGDVQAEHDSLNVLKLRLQLKVKELAQKEEEMADLHHQLQCAKEHELELEGCCRQFDQSLKAERQLRQDEVSSLRDRLEHIILTSNASLEVVTRARSQTRAERPVSAAEPKAKKAVETVVPRGRELMRSPSCPGLSSGTSTSLSPTAVALKNRGVVSRRKHLFEISRSKC